jgi:hypothetical protein
MTLCLLVGVLESFQWFLLELLDLSSWRQYEFSKGKKPLSQRYGVTFRNIFIPCLIQNSNSYFITKICVCISCFLICKQRKKFLVKHVPILMRNKLQGRLEICRFMIFSLNFFKEHLPDNEQNRWLKHVKGRYTEYNKSTYFYMYLLFISDKNSSVSGMKHLKNLSQFVSS